MSRQQEFLELIDSHKGILVKVSRIYFDTPGDQEELQQEIVYRLWKSYDSFTGESQFSSWMYRVAVNTAITFFKKSQDRSTEPIAIEPETDDSPSDHVERERRLRLFYQAVAKLTKVEKAVVFLFIEGCSHKEIGTYLGITEGNARVKLSRTKLKLKSVLKQEES